MFVAGLLLILIGAALLALIPDPPIPTVGKILLVIGVVVIILWVVLELADSAETAALLPLL